MVLHFETIANFVFCVTLLRPEGVKSALTDFRMIHHLNNGGLRVVWVLYTHIYHDVKPMWASSRYPIPSDGNKQWIFIFKPTQGQEVESYLNSLCTALTLWAVFINFLPTILFRQFYMRPPTLRTLRWQEIEWENCNRGKIHKTRVLITVLKWCQSYPMEAAIPANSRKHLS